MKLNKKKKKKRMGMGMIRPSCVVQMSDCVQASQLQASGTGPSLVKPTDSTGRTAVHRCSAPTLTAQMWDKQIPLFVYTWSLCTYRACLLAFCVRVVFSQSPMTGIVLRGHRIFWTFRGVWQLMALPRCHWGERRNEHF